MNSDRCTIDQPPHQMDHNLPENDLQIWILEPHFLPDEMERFWTLLSDQEQYRAKRYVSSHDRYIFIYIHGAIREIIGNYMRIPPSDLEFDLNCHGKPCLASTNNRLNLHFNISHSHNIAVLAINISHEVGIDIERKSRFSGLVQVARTAFSLDEQQFLEKLSGNTRWDAFYNIWTCREAFGKASGQGLFYDRRNLVHPDNFHWFVTPQGIQHHYADEKCWSIINIPCFHDYSLSVVTVNRSEIVSNRIIKDIAFTWYNGYNPLGSNNHTICDQILNREEE